MSKICIKCGEQRDAIRKNKLICGSVDSMTGELNQEFGRHRFTSYSTMELKKFSDEAQAEEEHWDKLAKQENL